MADGKTKPMEDGGISQQPSALVVVVVVVLFFKDMCTAYTPLLKSKLAVQLDC